MTPRWMAYIVSPVGILLLSAARLLIIADYNTITAITVASSGGYLNTLLGTLIPLVPVFVPYLALLFLLSRRFILSVFAFIFTAFVAPTPLTLPVTMRLASRDLHQLLVRFSASTGTTIIIVAIILAAAWLYYRSFAEALGAVAIAAVALSLLLAGAVAQLSLPVSLRSASASEQRLPHQLLDIAAVNWQRMAAIGILLAAGLVIYSRSAGMLVTTLLAITATIAIFPYVYNIYPVPRQGSYYAAVLHQPWLPAEKIKLSSDHIYYGYVLSSSAGWFTLLLVNSRSIQYLPAREIVSRVVCQAPVAGQPKQYPPLIPLFYSRPARTQRCPAGDAAANLAAIRSHGQSLSDISSMLHLSSGQIIAVTNRHQH